MKAIYSCYGATSVELAEILCNISYLHCIYLLLFDYNMINIISLGDYSFTSVLSVPVPVP